MFLISSIIPTQIYNSKANYITLVFIVSRRVTGKHNKDLIHKNIEEALYKCIDLQLNLRHLSDILLVISLNIDTIATLDRARYRIQLYATDKLHKTLIEIFEIAIALCYSYSAVTMVISIWCSIEV